MSSLAATQADGYYLPPEYYESGAYKKKSKNQWHAEQQQKGRASSATGAAAGGHQVVISSSSGQGVDGGQTVRFELVDPCVCLTCETRIGRGTRFNASKRKTSFYHSTPIFEFRTTCRRCGASDFVIRTDPQHRGFAYVSGLRKQSRTWDATTVGGITVEKGEAEDIEEDEPSPMDALERHADGARRALTERQELEQLVKRSARTSGDDVQGNAQLRDTFRQDRRTRKRLRREAAAHGWKESLSKLEGTLEEESQAKGTVFGNGRRNEHQRWGKVRKASIFSSPQPLRSSAVPPQAPISSNKVGRVVHRAAIVEQKGPDEPRQKRQIIVNERGGLSSRPPEPPHQSSSALSCLATGYGSSSDEEDTAP